MADASKPLRTEIDEAADTFTMIFSDNPVVRVEEHVVGGIRHAFHFDAKGGRVKIVVHEASKMKENAVKQERVTFNADPDDERIVNEFGFSLKLPDSDSLEDCYVRAPLKSFSIESLRSTEMNLVSVRFPLGQGFDLSFDCGEPTRDLPVGWAINPRRIEAKTFSWEWFERKSEKVYWKIQEGGEVRVRTHSVNDLQMITAIEFLTDVSLRFSDGGGFLEEHPRGRVGIRRGTVIQWPVLIDGKVVLLD